MNYLVTNLYDNPRKLYKYFPISKEYAIKVVDNGKYVGLMFAPNLSREDASSVGKVIDKWRAIALDGYIFYTSPQFFNDPFDTLLPKAPEIVPPLEERKYIIDVLRRAVTIKKDEVDRLLYSDDFDRALRIVLDSRHYDRSISEEIFKAYKMDRIPYKEEVAITCFSEVNNEQLMWAHYAGSYSGFCIEYDFSKSCDSAFLRGTAKVEYTNEKPCKDQFDDMGEYESKVMLTKSECWSYEKEWRSRKIAEYGLWKSKIYPIIDAHSCITAIYLGCNMPDEYQKVILDHYRNTEVKVFQMKLCDDKFDMYFEQC